MPQGKEIVLHYENFDRTSSNIFKKLRKTSNCYDVSLGCTDSNGRVLQAHKVVISSFSSVFKDLVNQLASTNSNNNHSMVFRGISYQDLSSILDFIYQGEVCINEERVASFLSVAEDLKVEGLSNIRISVKEGSEYPETPENISICNSKHNEYPPEHTTSNKQVAANRSMTFSEPDEQNDVEFEPKIETTHTTGNELSIDVEKTEKHNHKELHDTSLLANNFEIVEGKRRDTKIYRKDDFGYLLSKEGNSDKQYFHCVERNKHDISLGCRARAILVGKQLNITKEHNHPSSKMYFQINALEQRMKRRAEDSKESLRKIFDEECLMDAETAAYISFKSIRNSMEKRRRHNNPAIPKIRHRHDTIEK